jgi:glycosyltransferase involved in cell wall biosynthesis
MPYLAKEKLIYLHIPKTGGTSIELFFDMHHQNALCYPSWDIDKDQFLERYKDELADHPKRSYEPQHYSPELLRLLIPDYDQYYKFTFVRHPYERLISEFYYSRNWVLTQPHQFSPIEFDHWCRQYLHVVDHSHKEPQVFFLDDDIQFIGRFERINEDIKALSKELARRDPVLAIFQKKSLPFANHTGIPKSQIVDRLQHSTKEFLYDHYRADFDVLGYDPHLAPRTTVLSDTSQDGLTIHTAGRPVTLSVLITYYNYKEFIERCIQSVFQSELKDVEMEVVVVDDASKEEHAAVLDQIKLQHPTIKIIRNLGNIGLSKSRNIGINACTGTYIFILDADNEIQHDCLQRHIDELEAHQDAVACYAPIQSIDVDGNRMDYFRSNKPFSYEHLNGVNYIDAMAMFRRQSLIDLGLYDEQLSYWGWEDYDLWLRIGSLGLAVQFLPSKVLSFYREHDRNMSTMISNPLSESILIYLIRKYQLFSYLTINGTSLLVEHCSMNYFAQLFFLTLEDPAAIDPDRYFTEQESIRITPRHKSTMLSFTLPTELPILKLRFDPLNHYVQIRVHNIHFYSQGLLIHPEYDLNSNASLVQEGTYHFQTIDPQISIDFRAPEGIPLSRVDFQVTYDYIDLKWIPAPHRDALQALPQSEIINPESFEETETSTIPSYTSLDASKNDKIAHEQEVQIQKSWIKTMLEKFRSL